MKPVNLIPARRFLARQRQRHVRRCLAICWSWTFLVAGACTAGQGLVPAGSEGSTAATDTANLPTRLERVSKEVDLAQQNVNAARDELAVAQATLRTTRAIADQPDWSVLLALIGQATGDDVMLRTFDLQPIVASAASAGAATPKSVARPAPAAKSGGFLLSAGGLGQSQLGVSQFVLRLERIGLFSKVTLLDTSREAFRDGEATSFRVECVIDASPPLDGVGATAAPRQNESGGDAAMSSTNPNSATVAARPQQRATPRYEPWRLYVSAALVCVVLTAGGFALGIAPRIARADRVSAERAELVARRKHAGELAAAAAASRADLNATRDALAALPLRLEPASSVNQRLARLTDLASESNLSVSEVRPGAAVEGRDFDAVPISIAGSGSYPACAAFLHRLRDEFPDTAVRAFRAGQGDGSTAAFSVDLVWHTARKK